MKNFFKAMAFFLFCVVTYYGIALATFSETIGRKLPPVTQVITHKEFWSGHKVYDWVILGSSHAYRGLDPHIFEKVDVEVFNLGSSSQTPLNSLEIVKKLAGKTKGVILEVYPVTFNLSGRESFLDFLSSGYSIDVLWPLWWDLRDSRTLQLLLSKPIVDYYHQNMKPAEPSFRGYVESIVEAPANTQYPIYKLDNKENLQKQWDCLLKLIQYAKGSNLKLHIVLAPLPKALLIQGEDDFKQRLYALLRSYEVTFQDNSRNHTLDDQKDFRDADHLNARGVEQWNQTLIKGHQF